MLAATKKIATTNDAREKRLNIPTESLSPHYIRQGLKSVGHRLYLAPHFLNLSFFALSKQRHLARFDIRSGLQAIKIYT